MLTWINTTTNSIMTTTKTNPSTKTHDSVCVLAAGGAIVLSSLLLLSQWASSPPDPTPRSKPRAPTFFVRISDSVRPRLWYLRSLFRLKWNLWWQTGSSRLYQRRLEEFANEYDAQNHRLMPVSMDFCNYAIKQLVGIHGMFWILYAFCPCFWWDERVLCFYVSQLRYMMIKYALLPTVAHDDHEMVQAEDAYQLPMKLRTYLELRQRAGGRILETNVDWCTMPRVDMTVSTSRSNNDDNHDDDHADVSPLRQPLPVTFLPLNMAVICNKEPPAFGVAFPERNHPCPIPKNVQEPFEATMPGGGTGLFLDGVVYEDSPIPIFVSHRWKDQENPNASNDFVKLQNTLCHLVACAVQACLALLHDGFPLDLLVKHRPFLRPAFRIHNGPPVDWEELQQIDFGRFMTDVHKQRVQKISGHLVRDVFALTSHHVLLRYQTYEQSSRPYAEYRSAMQMEMMLDVMKRIWLWYDYACLPQSRIRDQNDELQLRFRRSLEYLPQLQNVMHTICLNDGKGEYFCRAWCMSEHLNANTSPLHGGRSLFSSSVTIGTSREEDALAYKWFELLINPTKGFNVLLEEMGLRFTNADHAKNNTPIICWIAWNSTLRREYFELEYSATPKNVTDVNNLRLLVGCGGPKEVSLWLECIQQAIEAPVPTDPGPFWIAMSRAGDSQLPYQFHTWLKKRDAASHIKDGNRSEIEELEVPFFPIPGNDNDAYLVRALSDARSQLSMKTCQNVRVYLRNVCQRTLRAENQDFVGDVEAY